MCLTSQYQVKPGIKPAAYGLQGFWFIHYTTATPGCLCLVFLCNTEVLNVMYTNFSTEYHVMCKVYTDACDIK